LRSDTHCARGFPLRIAVGTASPLTISAEIHDAVMALPPNERRDRAKVNEAVREGIRLGPMRPAGSADRYGVPKATDE
jgi:hypothetical protein